jgi:hypothetical protein
MHHKGDSLMIKGNKTGLGIAFLFTLISVVFNFLSRLSEIFTNGNLHNGLILFCWRSSLWVVISAGAIIVLYMFNKKSDQSISAMLDDTTIRRTAGILVVIDGLIKLAGLLPIEFMSIKSAMELPKQSGLDVHRILVNSVISDAISLIIIAIQIIFGVYMLKYYKKRNN